ncbi:MAG: hypothetical protein J6K42_03520 [Clostridia bacterium]|nr:hypothetical protein [Clostridia bacterium]
MKEKKCKKVDEDNEGIHIEECEADENGFKMRYYYNKVTKEVTSQYGQYSEMWRDTDKKMEITLDKDVFVPSDAEVDLEYGIGMSIEEFYNERRYGYYNFGFKDGKCIEMLPIRFTT